MTAVLWNVPIGSRREVGTTVKLLGAASFEALATGKSEGN